MHAVLITFRTDATLEDLVDPFTDYAHAMQGVAGLVSKTWITDGDLVGGFHIFESTAAADDYLDSEMVASLTGNDTFHGFEVRRFDILDELSSITGSPSVALQSSSL
ncbi:MAG: YdhR family protein [Acidimicrobiia bacterium]